MIPKRFRYYWDKRPQNRNRKLLMEVTLPKLPRRTTRDVDMMEVEEDKVSFLNIFLLHQLPETDVVSVGLYGRWAWVSLWISWGSKMHVTWSWIIPRNHGIFI